MATRKKVSRTKPAAGGRRREATKLLEATRGVEARPPRADPADLRRDWFARLAALDVEAQCQRGAREFLNQGELLRLAATLAPRALQQLLGAT